MRIAAISDIHGNIWALDAVLADIKALGVDAATPDMPGGKIERENGQPTGVSGCGPATPGWMPTGSPWRCAAS